MPIEHAVLFLHMRGVGKILRQLAQTVQSVIFAAYLCWCWRGLLTRPFSCKGSEICFDLTKSKQTSCGIFTKIKKFNISVWFSKRNMYRAAFQTLSRQSCRHLGSNIRLLRNVTPHLLQPTKFNLKQSKFCSTVTNQNDEQNITGHSTLFDYLPNVSQILCEFNGNSIVGLIFVFFRRSILAKF